MGLLPEQSILRIWARSSFRSEQSITLKARSSTYPEQDYSCKVDISISDFFGTAKVFGGPICPSCSLRADKIYSTFLRLTDLDIQV